MKIRNKILTKTTTKPIKSDLIEDKIMDEIEVDLTEEETNNEIEHINIKLKPKAKPIRLRGFVDGKELYLFDDGSEGFLDN